jgi:hypothetical protein
LHPRAAADRPRPGGKNRPRVFLGNARARLGTAALVEYHLWTLLGSLKSEDVSDGLFQIAVNAESQAVIDVPDPFREPDLSGDDWASEWADPNTYQTAVAEGKRRLKNAAADFVKRLEQRLERDRKRLQDYYRALSREAGAPPRKGAVSPSPEEQASQQRAVDLELRRKLAELNERYAFQAGLRPVAVARIQLPALVVPAVIQRREALREILETLERRCGAGGFHYLLPLPESAEVDML